MNNFLGGQSSLALLNKIAELENKIKEINVRNQYVNITNKITADNTKCTVTNAYVENGMVFILFKINRGFSGGVNGIFTVDPKYAPRSIIYGTHWVTSVSADFNKVNYILLNSSGACDVWMREKLEQNEPAQFIYPLRN